MDKRKGKQTIKKCTVEGCENWNEPYTLDESPIHFSRLKKLDIKCVLCSKLINYVDLFKHMDSDECAEQEDKENSDEEDNEEEKDTLGYHEIKANNLFFTNRKIFSNSEVKKLIQQTKCDICDEMIRFPFVVCTHLDCPNLMSKACEKCYVSWQKNNSKTFGQCWNKKHEFSVSGNDIFVQRYNEIDPSVDNIVKANILKILKIDLPKNYMFLKEMYSYLSDFTNEKSKERFCQIYKKFVSSPAEVYIDKSEISNRLKKMLNIEFKEKVEEEEIMHDSLL